MRKNWYTFMFPILLLAVLSAELVSPALAVKGSYPGINGNIAFSDNDPNLPYDLEIFVADNDGTNIQQLTHNEVDDDDPCWSPDGTKIAYASDSPRKIWIMDADGSNQNQLTTPPEGQFDLDPAWSPDGSKIAFWRTTGATGVGIYVINAAGPAGAGTLLINGYVVDPSWSPDGSEIAYASFGTIYVADAATGTLKRTLGEVGGEPCWSPDGTKIAFGASQIWVMNSADGSNQQQLSDPSHDDYDDEPNWSPDGQKIIFHRRLGSIWIMNADGSNEYDLTPTRSNAHEPDFQRLPEQEPTPTPRPVGGIVTPVNKLELLTPYLALAGLLIAVSVVVSIRRRKD